jgi:solute carrier family 25 carnitine/acylcarnitine transporter 20/29
MEPLESKSSMTVAMDLTHMSTQKRTHWEEIRISFLGGCIGGVSNVLSGHPLDTMKVRMQMSEIGFMDCIRQMFRTEGSMSFFKGVASPLYSIPFVYALYFGSYEFAKWA